MAVDRYSDGSYLESNPEWHEVDATWKAARVAELISEAGLVPSTLCDLGCGTGGVLAELRRDWPNTAMVGLDVSPQAVRIALQRHPEIDVSQGDLCGSQQRFDLILLLDVFEHVEDYLGFLRSLRDRGEHFIFHIPLDMAAQLVARSTPLLTKRREVGHLHYFSKDTALATLATAGYRVERWTYTAVSLDVPRPTVPTRLLACLRRWGSKCAPDLTANILGGFSLLVLATPGT